MAIEQGGEALNLLHVLRKPGWTDLPGAIQRTTEWLEREPIGTAEAQSVVAALVTLAGHEKWEVRRALAIAAGTCRHSALDEVLSRLAADSNARVQQAAEASALRRRDWRAAGLLGREHEQRLDRILEDIQHRFGTQGRAAVRRAASEMVSTFARELYHEVVKHITPLDREVQRLRRVVESKDSWEAAANHTTTIERDLTQLKAVLQAMREYAATPALAFSSEPLRDVVDQAARTVSALAESTGVTIENRVEQRVTADIARARVVQALSNLLYNAVEAYSDTSERQPIVVEATASDTVVNLRIRDHGKGMASEALADAGTLFATNKTNGTGVGLALAIKIVESEHEGRVEIESLLSVGTTVAVTFPRLRKSG
jgi:signal transduction histidine kinase